MLLTGGLLSVIGSEIPSVITSDVARRGGNGFRLNKADQGANAACYLVWRAEEFNSVCPDVVPPRAR